MMDDSGDRYIELLGRVILDSLRYGRECPLVVYPATEAEIQIRHEERHRQPIAFGGL